MKRLLRYDVGLGVALLALALDLAVHHYVLLAWASSAPLVSLLRHIWRNTDPTLRFGVCWAMFASSGSYLLFLHTAARNHFAQAGVVGMLVLFCFESACFAVNNKEPPR